MTRFDTPKESSRHIRPISGGKIDPYRLCCGSLLEGELHNGKVMLRCLRCGQYWTRGEGEDLVPVPRPRRRGRRNRPV
ncbi:MAG: hypothetical protein D6788_00080 [Planctomycetota bacterium]|nr:MAG: hypothetical protein D6788_00080 [Planctomycetota bacterium]